MYTVHTYVVVHAVVITMIIIIKDFHFPQSVSLFFSLYYIDSCFLDFYCEFSVFCFYVLCVSYCVFCCFAFGSFCVYTATPNPLQERPPHLGACRLPHYCTPLVCIPKFQGGLTVWLLYKPKPKPKPIDVSLRMHASPQILWTIFTVQWDCNRYNVTQVFELAGQSSSRSSTARNYFFEHIELPAKLLDYFLRSNKSNINFLVLRN